MRLHRISLFACVVLAAVVLMNACGGDDEGPSGTTADTEPGGGDAAIALVDEIGDAIVSCAASSGVDAYVSPEIDCTDSEAIVENGSGLEEITFTSDPPTVDEYQVQSLNGGQGYIVQTAVELDSQTVYFAQLAFDTSASFALCGSKPFDERSSVDSGGSNLPGCPDGTWTQ